MWTEKLKNGKIRYVERVKDISGKYKKISCTMDKEGPKNEKIAREILRKKELDLISILDNSITFFELLELFRRKYTINLKESTRVMYNYRINNIKKSFQDIRVNHINSRYIMQNLDDMSITDNNYNYYLQTIKIILKFAYEQDFIKSIEFLSKLRKKHHKTKEEKILYFEREEVNEIKNKLVNPVHKNLVSFLTNTGLRIGECLALTFDDINGDILTINKTLSQNSRTVSTTKTKAGARKISLNSECIKIIEEQRKINNNNLLLKNISGQPNIIFANTFNDYFNYNNLKATFKKNLGYNIQFHIFRHTHASLCIEAGIPLEMISKRLGHNSEVVTKEIYVHKTKKMEQIEFEQFRKISF